MWEIVLQAGAQQGTDWHIQQPHRKKTALRLWQIGWQTKYAIAQDEVKQSFYTYLVADMGLR